MTTEKLKEMLERYKATAELFLNKNIRAAIWDANDNYYFCDILIVGEEKIRVQCFAPENKKGLKYDLYYPLIIKIEEYKEEVENEAG